MTGTRVQRKGLYRCWGSQRCRQCTGASCRCSRHSRPRPPPGADSLPAPAPSRSGAGRARSRPGRMPWAAALPCSTCEQDQMSSCLFQQLLVMRLCMSGRCKALIRGLGYKDGDLVGNLLALGICSKVGIVLLRVNSPILSNVLDAALEVPAIAPQVKPRPCSMRQRLCRCFKRYHAWYEAPQCGCTWPGQAYKAAQCQGHKARVLRTSVYTHELSFVF